MKKKAMDKVRAWEKQFDMEKILDGSRKMKDYARYLRYIAFVSRESEYIPGVMNKSWEWMYVKKFSSAEIRQYLKKRNSEELAKIAREKERLEMGTWIDYYYDNGKSEE